MGSVWVAESRELLRQTRMKIGTVMVKVAAVRIPVRRMWPWWLRE